jgi:phage/plasmid-like protein (TIGR03299 family)
MTDTMFSAREVPWMKLGHLEDGVKTAGDAAKLGGLDFDVEQYPLQWIDDTDTVHNIPDRRALVRADTGEWLSIMSDNYPVLQFSEAFDFLDQVNPNFVAAGTLKGGKQGFMVAEGPELNVLNGEDPHKLYTVLRTSHDGSRAIEVAVMPLRNRCMNQLTLSNMTVGASHRWAIRHTSSMKQKLNDAHQSLQRLDEYARSYEQVAEKLATVQIDDNHAYHVLKIVLPERPKREMQINSIIDRWHTAETVGFNGTGWGLLNATSEYFEWGRAGGNLESRFVGALQGSTHKAINGVASELLLVA